MKLITDSKLDIILEANFIPNDFSSVQYGEFIDSRAHLIARYANDLAGL